MNREKMRAIKLADSLLDERGRIRGGGPIQSTEVIRSLESFNLSLCSTIAEELVRSTLGLEGELTDRDVVWAVFSALLCPLHQTIGSCFATAPAILIHEEQPLQFLQDIKNLLMRGELSRTFNGNTYTVPISIVAPREEAHLLLRTWEYTLASFVDVKAEASRWNLYASLGLEAEEKEGIGQVIYSYLDEKLQEANQKVREYQSEYDEAYDHVKTAESLLRGASTEADIRRLKAELQGRVYHFEASRDMRDKYHKKAHEIANFFPFVIERITEELQKHFQEVYDPEMRPSGSSTYDDAPAGFRLLHKHGRTYVGSWSRIEDGKGYIEALRQFFLAIEHSLIEEPTLKKEVSEVITAVVQHIETKGFLERALERMAKAYQGAPGSQKKPWAYTSGGTLTTLLQTYFCKETPLTVESRWVDSPQDLLIFLLETMKKLPPKITDLYRKNPNRRMLMTSPTHVFSLLPGESLFREGWEDPGFTYTWVRDRVIIPHLRGAQNPIVFADSNWEGVFFSFVVNRENGELELWRTDRKAEVGEPMVEWNEYLNGRERMPWKVFTNPFEYQTN